MPNNLFANIPAAVVAKITTSFAAAGLTSTNIAIIYEVGNPLKSWVPGRSINPITGFEIGKGYYVVPKQDLDLSTYLIPPIPTGGNITPPAPTGGTVDDTADTFAYTLASGYILSDHEQSLDGGGTWGAASNPISVGNIAKAAGQIRVRVKAATGRDAGPALQNATAFNVAAGETFEDIVFDSFFADTLVNTSGVWTSAVNDDQFGHKGELVAKKFPAGGNAKMKMHYAVGSDGAIFGYNADVPPSQPYAYIGLKILSGALTAQDSTTAASQGAAVAGNWYQIVKTGSGFKLQTSADDVTYTDVYNYTAAWANDMWAMCDIGGGPSYSLHNPKATGLV